MSVEHLDIVHKQLPEFFATKELPENWDEGLIIVPVPDVERITKPEPLGLPTAPADLREDNEADILEHFGEYVDQGVSPVVPSPEIVQVLGGTYGGSPLPYTDRSKTPPPDCHAFYLPFHYFYPIWWGVYLLYEGVLWLGTRLSVGQATGLAKHSRLPAYFSIITKLSITRLNASPCD